MAKPKFPDNLDASERLTLAKDRSKKLVDHIATLFLMHEANAAVIYSPQLAAQIPVSYAAHAFNQFQRSMYLFEILRLCALWDRCTERGGDRESIPVIIALFDKPELIDQLAQEAHATHATECQPANLREDENDEDPEAIGIWWNQDREYFADKQSKQIRKWLTVAKGKAKKVENSLKLNALRTLRDNYIAHNLDFPEPDIKTMTSITPFKVGDEASLLEQTVSIANALHHGLNRTAFDWNGSREIARRNARFLWGNCTFHIPTHPTA